MASSGSLVLCLVFMMVELVVMVMGGVEGSMAEVEELLYEDQSQYR